MRAQATLERLVTAPPAEPMPGDSRAEVRVVQSREGWRATVAIEHAGVSTRRSIEAPTCEALADAVGLIVAVAVDPLRASATVGEALAREDAAADPPEPGDDDAPSPARPEVVPRPEQAPAPDPEPPPEPPVRRRRALYGSALIVGGGAIGVLPPPGGTLGGGLALGVGWLRVELSGHHRFVASVSHPTLSTAGAEVALTAGRASACFAPAFRWFSLPMCGGLELGAFRAKGFGITNIQSATKTWVAAVPQLRPTVRATRWLAFGLDLQLPLPLLRPGFAIDDLREPVFVGGPVGFRFGLAVELVFARRSGTKSDEGSPVRASE